MKNNTFINKNLPVYIFSENKNNTIDIDRKTLTYENVMVTITKPNGESFKTTIIFQAGFPTFSSFLKGLQHQTNRVNLSTSILVALPHFIEARDVLIRKTRRTSTPPHLLPQLFDQIEDKNLRIHNDQEVLRVLQGLPSNAYDAIFHQSGIYMFTNLINKKRYIGKASDLRERLKFYSNNKALQEATDKSRIARAILEFGMDKFSFSIIEHCEPELLLKRERFYIKVFKPQYNIRKAHTAETTYPLSL